MCDVCQLIASVIFKICIVREPPTTPGPLLLLPTHSPLLLLAHSYSWPTPTPGPLLLLAHSYSWPTPTPGPLLLLAHSYSWPTTTPAPLLLLAHSYSWPTPTPGPPTPGPLLLLAHSWPVTPVSRVMTKGDLFGRGKCFKTCQSRCSACLVILNLPVCAYASCI